MKKVVVIGAGNVGAHIVSAGIIKNLPIEFHLIDHNQQIEEAQVLDLCDSTLFSPNTRVYASQFSDESVQQADIFIITAGAKQEVNETRLELLKKNRKILVSIKESLGEIKSSAIIIMVSNPVDVLTSIAQEVFNLPSSQIFGSGTLLDTARLRVRLSQELKTNTSNIHGYVLGEHGDSEFIAWSTVQNAGTFNQDSRDTIEKQVKQKAYRIIEGKGSTYFGIGTAVMEIVEAIIGDSEKIFPLSVYLHGEYGISNIALGVPAKVGEQGIKEVLELDLTKDEIQKLNNCASILQSYQ
jgi:L-lactate dehydrogenase